MKLNLWLAIVALVLLTACTTYEKPATVEEKFIVEKEVEPDVQEKGLVVVPVPNQADRFVCQAIGQVLAFWPVF